jgi:hypothetical protein
MVFNKFYLPTGVMLGAAVIAVVLGTSSSSAVRYAPLEKTIATAAEQAFADAPYGVDSMVTGPTSASFKQRQDDLNCNVAVWPNVPMGCFPG